MTDLPIINSSSSKPAANKPASNADTNAQGAQDFGNVLARQVSDKSQPSDSGSRSSADTSTPAKDLEPVETTVVSDSGNAVPADIMAALLAQQSQPASAPAEISLQQSLPGTPEDSLPSIADNQAVALPFASNIAPPSLVSARETAASAIPGSENSAPALLKGGKAIAPKAAIQSVDAALPLAAQTFRAAGGFADALKPSAAKDLNIASTAAGRGNNLINELPVVAAATLQPSFMSPETAAIPSTSTVSIATAVNQPAWGDDFSQTITWMATQRNQSAELHLNPPQLGPLDVVLKMNGDQASAVFTSPHAAVREAIEQAIPKLREMLADSGITLGNAMVSDHSAQQNRDNSPRRSQNGTGFSDANNDVISTQEARVSTIKRHNGMVDTFA